MKTKTSKQTAPKEQSIEKPEAAQRRTGTKEWAEHNVNFQQGCEHLCRYCYARYNAVVRFKQCSPEQWASPTILPGKVNGDYKKYDGIVMFPTSHDITPKNLAAAMTVLGKLLAAGNDVLIVSKPHWPCITHICELLVEYRNQMMFRFTIGSKHNSALSFWEPKAPGFDERLSCLKYAYTMRYRTSVSCEPYLDEDVVDLYLACKQWITDSFWIGLLRDFEKRVDLTGVSPGLIDTYVEPLKAAQSAEKVRELYNLLRIEKLVRWKDSVREIIEREQCKA